MVKVITIVVDVVVVVTLYTSPTFLYRRVVVLEIDSHIYNYCGKYSQKGKTKRETKGRKREKVNDFCDYFFQCKTSMNTLSS